MRLVSAALGSELKQGDRIAERDSSATRDVGIQAEGLPAVAHDGSEDARILGHPRLFERGHHAAHRRNGDCDTAVADREFAASPSVFRITAQPRLALD